MPPPKGDEKASSKVKKSTIRNLLSPRQRDRLKEKKTGASQPSQNLKLKDQLKAIPQLDGETKKAYKLRALREVRAGKKTQKPAPKAKAKAKPKAAAKKPPYSVWPLKKGADAWGDASSAGKGKGKGKASSSAKGQSKGKDSKGSSKGKSSSKSSKPTWWNSDSYVTKWKPDNSRWKKDSSAKDKQQWTKQWSKVHDEWKWEWKKNW